MFKGENVTKNLISSYFDHHQYLQKIKIISTYVFLNCFANKQMLAVK